MSAERLARLLKEKGLTAATAESCTCGMIAETITSVPGASCVFHCGIVAYSNEIKERVLGVKPETIARFSAVSGETAAEMAAGARKVSGADIALSVTGNAGPEPSEGKPVGEVWIAADAEWGKECVCCHFTGSRNEIRREAADKALDLAIGLSGKSEI